MGLSEAANKSRQNKSYAEWTHYKKGTSAEIEVDKAFREKMIKREQELEIQLQQQIDQLVKENAGGS